MREKGSEEVREGGREGRKEGVRVKESEEVREGGKEGWREGVSEWGKEREVDEGSDEENKVGEKKREK